MASNVFKFSGHDGNTAEYRLSPLSPQDISTVPRGEPEDLKRVNQLKRWWERVSQATSPAWMTDAAFGTVITANSPA
jgi:hypothetical protein